MAHRRQGIAYHDFEIGADQKVNMHDVVFSHLRGFFPYLGRRLFIGYLQQIHHQKQNDKSGKQLRLSRQSLDKDRFS